MSLREYRQQGAVERGVLSIDRVAFASALKQFSDGQVVLRLEAPRRKRSLDQNAYLHAEPFPKLAKAWGESIARAKLICMGEFWGWEPVNVDGIRVVLPVKAHTSDMTVEECTHFIDWLIPWAGQEHDTEITLPDEWAAKE